MASTPPSSRRRKFLKLSLITFGVLLVSILGLHIWFVNNARGILKQIVSTKSHGKLKMELSQISFDFLTNKIKIREADLVNTDSVSTPTTYHVKFRKLTLRVGSFWALLLQRKLILDSIKLHDPEIEVLQWRRDTSSKITKDELSISQEMGKLYNSMLDALDGFGIRRIIINNAKLSLINKMKQGVEPVSISNIYFDLIRTASDVDKRDEFVENEQSIELRTTNQNIALPGGRHRLAFKNFHLELFQKRIVMDSCTVTAISTDSTKSSYSIFFKKLLLIGVDFDAMYRRNLIRADSVYCENPLFNINLTTTNSAKKKEQPDPDKIIQELTGDLDLAFVGVKDAGIHINISGRKNRSLFNSNRDDFEMRGLKIISDSTKPVTVQRFDMLVRDYRLYNEDSSAAYTFDSIHFVNNKIVLSNFSVATALNTSMRHNYRDFKIPYFELTGLNWYSLIFDQNLIAREAVLYNPIIRYKATKQLKARKKKGFFTSLSTLDDLITLNKIEIINGQLNMQLSPTTSLDLKNVNLNLYSDRLLNSTNKEGLKRAVERLDFTNGIINLKTITAKLQNVRYTGNNLVQIDRIDLAGKTNQIKGWMKGVTINDLLLDDAAETMVLDGFKWNAAQIALNSTSSQKKNSKGGNIQLKNLSGGNTDFRFVNGKTNISTYVQSFKLASLSKSGKAAPFVNGLVIGGNKLSVRSGPMNIYAASYAILSNGISDISGVKIERYQDRDSLNVQAPRINFSADINSILAKDFHLTSVDAISPVITINKWNTTATPAANQTMPIRIDRIVATEPVIHIATHRNDSVSVINLPYSDNSLVKASGLRIDGDKIQLSSFSVSTTSATFVKSTGEIIGVEKGNVDLALSDIQLSKKDGKPVWSAIIDNLDLQNPNNLFLGRKRNKLSMERASVGNVRLSSEYLSNFDQLVKFNVSAWLRTATGQYIDSNTTLKWYNAEYNSGKKTLSLDSFTYFPTQPRDSVIAYSAYQTDYLTFHSGAIKLTDFNLERYKKDSAIIANTLNINNPIITTYRDKQPPFLAGIIKPLPVDAIQKINVPISLNNINLINGTLKYTEKNAKTRAEGTLVLNRMNVGLSNIKNRNITINDSLTLTLNAFLMDSAELNLRVKESYADSLSGFLMSLRMKPTTLSFLNPVLAPLSNVIITSGTIDSFHLRAIGQDELSLGEMNMYYHDLKIKLVKDGDMEKSSFGGRVASFLANALIIKKNNNGRTGLVYFERLRDRSFFNYIVKMTFSGMATSIGVKKNRKYMKQYKKELQQRSLPSIEFE